MILVIIIIILLIVVLILHQNHKKLARMDLLTANIPGPKGYPLIGSAFELVKGDGILENMIRIIEFYGKEKRLYKQWLGPKLFIGLSSPNDVEEILSNPNLVNKSFVYSFLEPLTGLKNIFISNGETWKTRRKIIMPTFQTKMIEQFMKIFNKNSKLLVENLECELSKQGFDVLHYNDLFTTDVIAETALGVEVGVQRTKNFELCKNILHRLEYLFIHRVSRPWTYPDIIFNMTSAGHEQKKLIQKLYGFIQGVIDSKKQKRLEEKDLLVNNEQVKDVIGEKKGRAFMDALLDSYEKADSQLTHKDISAEIILIMIAGQSTTAATISYAMHALSKHQDIQDKVVQELNEIFKGSDRDPTFHDIKIMKYMEMVLKETMRMWPAVPYIARSVQSDIKLKHFPDMKLTSEMVLRSKTGVNIKIERR